MPEYRRHQSAGVWHSCRTCAHDPKADFLIRYVRPANDRDLCPTCMAADLSEDVCRRVIDQQKER